MWMEPWWEPVGRFRVSHLSVYLTTGQVSTLLLCVLRAYHSLTFLAAFGKWIGVEDSDSHLYIQFSPEEWFSESPGWRTGCSWPGVSFPFSRTPFCGCSLSGYWGAAVTTLPISGPCLAVQGSFGETLIEKCSREEVCTSTRKQTTYIQ